MIKFHLHNRPGKIKPVRSFYFTALLFSLLSALPGISQKAEAFSYDCVVSGQQMLIDAEITDADASTFYHWQFKTGANPWTCFENGMNTINGAGFTVTGATGMGSNNAPLLTIASANAALENVLVRVVMARGADPCGNPQPAKIWGGDDENPGETKYLRLHVVTSSASCAPNSFLCTGNVLVDGTKYYGGFENTDYNVSTDAYTRNNIGGNGGSSDYSFGTGNGRYQDINNPYAMNPAFSRDIAPHSGNYQFVVEGSANPGDRAWYKSVPVIAGRQYAFSVWVTRVDNTDPIIELRANSSILVTLDLSNQPPGVWMQVQGTYLAASNGNVIFSLRDGKAGGDNNFSIDDMCVRRCVNCATLELHQLYLSAVFQQNEVKVKWIAENEMGTINFIIERSFDGMNFDQIGSKLPSGPQNIPTAYYFTDPVQNIGVYHKLYYRIKAMDRDGRHAYSNIVIIKLSTSAEVQAWPIPFGDNVNISYNAIAFSRVDISIINSIGKTVKQSTFTVNRGINQFSLGGLEAIPSGIYFVRITDRNSNEVYIHKISK